jgi:hypothetical protein
MRFTATRSSESLDDLVTRAYAFERKPRSADLRAARRALVDANPFLKRLDDVPPETVVSVPPIEEAEPAGETTEVGPLAVTAMLARLRSGVEALAASLEADLEREVTASRETISLAGSAEVKRLAGSDPAVAGEARETRKAVEARIGEAQALEEYRRAAFAQVERDADELLAAFSEPGERETASS